MTLFFGKVVSLFTGLEKSLAGTLYKESGTEGEVTGIFTDEDFVDVVTKDGVTGGEAIFVFLFMYFLWMFAIFCFRNA